MARNYQPMVCDGDLSDEEWKLEALSSLLASEGRIYPDPDTDTDAAQCPFQLPVRLSSYRDEPTVKVDLGGGERARVAWRRLVVLNCRDREVDTDADTDADASANRPTPPARGTGSAVITVLISLAIIYLIMSLPELLAPPPVQWKPKPKPSWNPGAHLEHRLREAHEEAVSAFERPGKPLYTPSLWKNGTTAASELTQLLWQMESIAGQLSATKTHFEHFDAKLAHLQVFLNPLCESAGAIDLPCLYGWPIVASLRTSLDAPSGHVGRIAGFWDGFTDVIRAFNESIVNGDQGTNEDLRDDSWRLMDRLYGLERMCADQNREMKLNAKRGPKLWK
ncbi:hypothetical protein UCRNP2_5923 [Neofusicoccum parvum UCRNP2]|uniref:Uncharacterized protein n=1 Tax=Botryosphaeria parva (strain UCR-NP2) TaxID=1287680 RepID=R1GGD0_BOTPV|nr:hypothetical protein UCRNP2_5923 [Neofusicoccum parvum UCRNP2]